MTTTETRATTGPTTSQTVDTVGSLTGATLLFIAGLATAGWVVEALRLLAFGEVDLAVTPAVGVLAMTVLAGLLLAFAWTLAVRGLTGLARIVSVEGLGRY